jgi:hypothetical protein
MITMRWEKLKITDELVLGELRRPTRGDCSVSSSTEDGNPKIQIGDDFSYEETQFVIKELIGDSQFKCVVIESNGTLIVGDLQNVLREFVRDGLLVNY